MLTHIRNVALGALAVLTLTAPAPAQSCTGDLNDDGVINGADLGQLLAAWGPCQSCEADLSANGVVDGADLGVQLANWGECISVPGWATVVESTPDPAVVTDPALRAAIMATGLAWRVRDTATQVELLLVPPGTFQMGCTMSSNQYPCYSHEQPVHQVTLTSALYLGRYEVTQAQWVLTMGSNPSYFQTQPDSASRPVEQVNWNDIQGYLSATGFRLPTEAEWEYACRAGTQTPLYNGSTDGWAGALGWFWDNVCWGGVACETRPVGGRLANAFGFHDMLGNVAESVNDWYGGYAANAQTNPTGPVNGSERVLRGGNILSQRLSSSSRDSSPPDLAFVYIGFRVARNP